MVDRISHIHDTIRLNWWSWEGRARDEFAVMRHPTLGSVPRLRATPGFYLDFEMPSSPTDKSVTPNGAMSDAKFVHGGLALGPKIGPCRTSAGPERGLLGSCRWPASARTTW